MRKIGFVFASLSVVLGLGTATPGHAQTFHSFVAGNGSGTTCTLAAPCSNIQAAVTATNAGGIVSCLDQAANSDGATVLQVNITKSITIDCAGTSAAAYFVTINGTGIVVTLRNLQINMVETVGG